MTGIPAGWYEDSNTPGSDRYWDGISWTGQTRQTLTSPPAGTTPGIVILGFTLSLLGFCGITALIGLVLSLIVRKEAKAAGRGVGLNLAAIVVAGLWLLLFALSMVVGALSGPSTSTTVSTSSANPSASVEETKEPIATPSAAPSEDKCSKWEAYAQESAKAGNKPAVDAAMKSAKRLGCTFSRPKLVRTPVMAGYTKLAGTGFAYKWITKVPKDDYYEGTWQGVKSVISVAYSGSFACTPELPDGTTNSVEVAIAVIGPSNRKVTGSGWAATLGNSGPYEIEVDFYGVPKGYGKQVSKVILTGIACRM